MKFLKKQSSPKIRKGKIIIIFFIILFIYLFFIRTIRINQEFFGEVYYTKNSFTVFYNVEAGRSCDNCRKYDKRTWIINSDPKTFTILNKYYTKDKNNIYICSWSAPDIFRIKTKCEKIKAPDRDTFETIKNSYYAKDKNKVYYFWKSIENSDVKTFKVVNYDYAIDKNKVYYHNREWLNIINNLSVEEFILKMNNFDKENPKKDLTLIMKSFINY